MRTGKVLIKVSQEYIDSGKRKHSTECPIALCMHDALGGTWEVDDCAEYVSPHGDKYRASLPEVAAGFVSDFDSGNKVFPITFEVDVELVEPPEDEPYDF